MLDFSASKGVDLAREGGPADLASKGGPGKAEGKECLLLSNSNHGYYVKSQLWKSSMSWKSQQHFGFHLVQVSKSMALSWISSTLSIRM